MDANRSDWNTQQKRLRALLSDPSHHQEAIDLFLQQHANVHSGRMSSSGSFSFEDEIMDDMKTHHIREVPGQMDHSVAWILWHIARIEDVVMNMLVAGKHQVMVGEEWSGKLKVTVQHTGNAMARKDVVDLSENIEIEALREYRMAVGRRTEEIAKVLEVSDMKQKVLPSRMELLLAEGIVLEKASGLIEYWSSRDIAGLLLMPPTRHCFIHLNEAAKIKKRLQR